jgi:ABC-type transport system involved in multi-copper enzyme maturation permease subunit
MPRFLHWFLRFSIFNPICLRLVGTASRRRKDLYLRAGYVAILAAVLVFGLLFITASGRFSLRDLAAGSANVFVNLSVLQLILICLLTPIFMASAITKEANPKTWDILLTTPLSPLQIVLGNLFGRLFFIAALLIGALPLMVVTQFFGGVPLDTILLTQLVAFCLALSIAAAAIAMSVTRTSGRKAAVSFFVVTVLYILVTFVFDNSFREPITVGSTAHWTTILTPFNPFLVLEALLQPSRYAVPQVSAYPWPFGWAVTHPVAAWCWFTVLLSSITIVWSSLQVRKLGQSQARESFWKRAFSTSVAERKSHIVTGNPIAWRERVTRHRNLGSLLGRWGFVAICTLTLIILTTLYFTRSITPETFRIFILSLVCGELLIITFSAITMSASTIAKEREDGSLDLILTTAITPKIYLGGKLRGLILHLLPMVLVPCLTMMVIGGIVLIDPENAIVSDLIVVQKANTTAMVIPLALYMPALLSPLVVIPYIAFCTTLGLLWSMRSKGSIGAIITSVILVLLVTGGLGVCLLPSSNLGVIGSFFASLSPINNVFATLTPASTLPVLLRDGVYQANLSLGITSFISGGIWMLISFGLLRSMASSFVVTVRRLAGTV